MNNYEWDQSGSILYMYKDSASWIGMIIFSSPQRQHVALYPELNYTYSVVKIAPSLEQKKSSVMLCVPSNNHLFPDTAFFPHPLPDVYRE